MSKKIFVIGNSKQDKFLCIDANSGGYPWISDKLYSAERYFDISTAAKAVGMFNSLSSKDVGVLYELKLVEAEFNIQDLLEIDRQIAELKARKEQPINNGA